MSSRSTAAAILSTALAYCLCATGVGAHEIGSTRVSVLLARGTYEIEIITDAAALVEKLQASAGSYPAFNTPADRLEHLLTGFDGRFLQRARVAFDGVDARPAAAFFVVPAVDGSPAAAAATVRLTGDIPHGARHFTWSYGWTFAAYPLTVRGDVGSPVTQWLEGGQPSAPVALAAPPPPVDRFRTAWRYLTLGFTHIVPHGLDHVLFVLGIYLLSTRARTVLWQVSAFTIAPRSRLD
jgi:hypothetical protein